MGVTIKDAELLESIQGMESLPVSDGSNTPRKVNIEQIGKFAESLVEPRLDNLASRLDNIEQGENVVAYTAVNLLQNNGLLDSLDKIKQTYHSPILELYDGGIKVSASLDNSNPYPNIYLQEVEITTQEEEFLVLVDLDNIGGGLLQFYMETSLYSTELGNKGRFVKADFVKVGQDKKVRLRIQCDNQEVGVYVVYSAMIFKMTGVEHKEKIKEDIISEYLDNGYKSRYTLNVVLPKELELWGDSLTEQNYGKYIQGIKVYSNGYGGKTSTYIRDQFLKGCNKDRFQVIWVGRNNYSETDVVIDDIRDMVEHLGTDRFLVMCPPNGGYGDFGTNGTDGTGEMKGGFAYGRFAELEKRLEEEYPSNFINVRKAAIQGWRMGNVRLESSFIQPAIGGEVTVNVSNAVFLTTYNTSDLESWGESLVKKVRIGLNGMYDLYDIVEYTDETHIRLRLVEANNIQPGKTVGNIVEGSDPGPTKFLRVMQNADYLCWMYDTTLSTFRKDSIHMTDEGLKLIAKIVGRKVKAMGI